MIALLAGILLHVALGTALAGVVWSVGLGWRIGGVYAYPIGLLTVTVGALLVLLTGWLALLVLPLVFWLLVRARSAIGDALRRVRGPLAWALPGAVALPVALGLHLHGPTSELDSNAYGDMVFYAAKLVSATESVVPFRDLLVEGEASAYVEAGSSFLGGALARLPGLDPFLFQTTAMPAFLLASIPIGLGLLGGRDDDVSRSHVPGPDPRAWLPVTGLLAVTMVAYPTWLTESPPVALALPLTFAVYGLACDRLPLGRFAVVAAVCAVDFALTKGFGVIPLTVLVVFAFARDHLPGLDRRRLLAVGGAVAALGAAGLAFFLGTSGWLTEIFSLKFLPADAVRGLADQLDARDTQAAGPAFELAGSLALALALLRARATPFLTTFAVALLGHWLVGGHGFDILVGMSILLSALLFRRRPELLRAQGALILAAAALLTISAWFRDISAVRAGFVFVALLAVALVGAFAERRVLYAYAAVAAAVLVGLSGRSLVAFCLLVALFAVAALQPRARWLAAGLALAGGLAVAAVSDLRLTTYDPTLTTDHYAVWQRAEEVVPPDGLVFTSLTGPVISGDQGWNYYPGITGRQIYLAGWSTSP
ncbi:MAG: hypothetical protein ACRDNX_13250, partial [Gaiellaceae bacterium]